MTARTVIPSITKISGIECLRQLLRANPNEKYIIIGVAEKELIKDRTIMNYNHYIKTEGKEIAEKWASLRNDTTLDDLFKMTPRWLLDFENIRHEVSLKNIFQTLIKESSHYTEHTLDIGLDSFSKLMEKLNLMEEAIREKEKIIENINEFVKHRLETVFPTPTPTPTPTVLSDDEVPESYE